MRKLATVLIILFAISCKNSDDPKPNTVCDQEHALLQTIEAYDGVNTINNFKYDNNGHIIRLTNTTLDKQITYFTETYTWKSDQLTGFERMQSVTNDNGDVIDNFISEKCTYVYSGNKIVTVNSEQTFQKGDPALYDEISITYDNTGRPVTFYSDRRDMTVKWIYNSDGNVAEVKKDNLTIVTYTFSTLKNYFPETYLYARVFKTNGMFYEMQKNAVNSYSNYNNFGEISSSVEYTYTVDADQKIATFQAYVTSCPACINDVRTNTYTCL